MSPLNENLIQYCNDKERRFSRHHRHGFRIREGQTEGERANDFFSAIGKFLHSTMDETRLAHSRTAADAVLWISHLDDASYFRDAVLRRELLRHVSYQKHRDHSAHTLNNYLLGWYIFDHSAIIRDEFARVALLRQEERADDLFFHIWPHVSLLHDVGYVFEGSSDSQSSDYHSDHTAAGARVIKDFFDHAFWVEIGLSPMDRDAARTIIGDTEVRFASGNLNDLARDLRRLSDITDLIPDDIGKTSDAFLLWERHFRSFGMTEMADRIRVTQFLFERCYIDGLGQSGLRILDHGVCSGLLLLQHSTLYFKLRRQLKKDDNEAHRDLKKRFFEQEAGEIGLGYSDDSSHWWKNIVWATGSCMIHNVVQMEPGQIPSRAQRVPKLSIKDDPLAFLGILVDCVQEWDRYQVERKSVWNNRLPLQGNELTIASKDGKIEITYPDKQWATKVRDNLGIALQGWGDVLVIKP